MKNRSALLKISAVLWVIWGIVHILAGVLTVNFVLNEETSKAIAGIADKVDPVSIERDYPAAAGAVIGQHGFNLFWIGIVTMLSAIYIWKQNSNAIFLAAIVGGLADLGYFLFMDLGGFVNFVPGTVMTIVSSAAIITSFLWHFQNRKLLPSYQESL